LLFTAYFFPKHLDSFQRVRLLLTGVAKDTNSNRDVVNLTLTKSGWLPSMKYMEYVVKITETVISLEVQFKFHFLESCIHRFCNGQSFSKSSSSSFRHIQLLAFVQLLALRPVYPQVLIKLLSIICQSGQLFSHSGSHIVVKVLLNSGSALI